MRMFEARTATYRRGKLSSDGLLDASCHYSEENSQEVLYCSGLGQQSGCHADYGPLLPSHFSPEKLLQLFVSRGPLLLRKRPF